MRPPNDEARPSGDRASARTTALAYRKLAQTTRAVAEWQRRRGAALHELADALIAEADATGETSGIAARFHGEAGRFVALADHTEATAKALDQQATLAATWAADADERAGERRRGRTQHVE
jgi:hypothetical protein